MAEQLSEEQGVLPVVLDGDIDAFWAEVGPVPPLGMRAGLFHPVTGYSLPSAVALADAVAAALPARPESLRRMIEARARATWQAQGFYRVLNRMLFLAGTSDQRWRVFARFFAPAAAADRTVLRRPHHRARPHAAGHRPAAGAVFLGAALHPVLGAGRADRRRRWRPAGGTGSVLRCGRTVERAQLRPQPRSGGA